MQTRAATTVRRGLVCLCLSFAAGAGWGMPHGVPDASAGSADMRDGDPVLIKGSALPAFAGVSLARLGLFRFDPLLSEFEPVPFQIDEQVDHVFNPGTSTEFTELVYDVFGEDDGLLDGNDELVFLFGDGGPQAPTDAPWPEDASATRFEIAVQDPRSGAPVAARWFYLFVGDSLPESSVEYVDWDGSCSGEISSATWSLDFEDRWLLTGLHVASPCGTGEDLIDRVKGRAGNCPLCETEELWNDYSTCLGGILGPVRAIRYVRGAASGTNTVHHDVVYARFWNRIIQLRVHGIGSARLYLDLRPHTGTVVFTPTATDGVAVDGDPDPEVDSSFVPWSLTAGPEGGLVTLYEVPPSPKYASKNFFYEDDLDYDDADGGEYPDEDDAAFGDQGVELRNLTGTLFDVDAIYLSLRYYPLCTDEGDAALGDAFQEMKDQPLRSFVFLQRQALGPVNTLRVTKSGNEVVFSWQSVAGATSYRLYHALSPDAPHASWEFLGETSDTAFEQEISSLPSGYYSVVGASADGEGEW